MNLVSRSYWTGVNPRRTPVGDKHDKLPYFEERPNQLEFYPVNDGIVHLFRNPVEELNQLLKTNSNTLGLSDLDYNFAIAQNTKFIYTIRGFASKSTETKNYKILVLLGSNEKPTDQLKENVKACEELLTCTYKDIPVPNVPLSEGDDDVHAFNLIEYLFLRHLYTNRNNGYYGPFTTYGVKKLQDQLNLPTNGAWDRLTIDAVESESREYITLSKEKLNG